MSIQHLTSSNYDKVAGSGYVLVDFWASWCMPCRMVAPIIEELAEEYDGRVTVAKVDTDSEAEIANRYGIRSIPTVILFSDGIEVKRFIGAQPKAVYESELRRVRS